jgi:hypothetical protein
VEAPTTATVETSAHGAVESASPMVSADRSAGVAASAVVPPSTVVAASAVVAAPAVKASTVAPATPTPTASPAIPRAGANEHAIRKPVSPIVAVRSASIGIVAVVSVGTSRRGSNPDTYCYLRVGRLRINQRQRQNRNQSQIS